MDTVEMTDIRKAAPVRGKSTTAIRERAHILLVEDDPTQALYLRSMLTAKDANQFEISRAASLGEAHAFLAQSTPDLILLDLTLPDSNGFSTFNSVHVQASNLPIIVSTGQDSDELAQRCLQAGAQDYLIKGERKSPSDLTRAVWYAIERKRQELRLRESDHRFHQLIHSAPLGIVVFDPMGSVTLTNPAFRDLIQSSDPDLHDEFVNHFLTRTDLADRINRCIAQGERSVFEVAYTLDQNRSLQLRVHLAPLHQENGEVTSVQALFEDVTQHREHERQTNHRQKLESVGALAAGIAHEINTPIQFIGDNTHFLTDAFQDLIRLLDLYDDLCQHVRNTKSDPVQLHQIKALETEIDLAYLKQEVPEALAQTLEGVKRVAAIVNAMRVFAHPVAGIKHQVDLNEALQNTLTVARTEYKYLADIVLDLDPDLPLVSCDLGEINQAFLNMIVNAAHAIKDRLANDPGVERGTITLTTRGFDDHVKISIGDTGTGIPPELKERIFDPFFTTKPVGQGTGQGLAIAHSTIVKNHGGQIHLDSEVGKGTTFTIQLPVASEEGGHG